MQSIVVKACYGGNQGLETPEIRRIPFGMFPSLPILQAKLKEKFPELQEKSFNIYWKDSDGDMIQCSSEDELKEAMTSIKQNVLKLFINVSGGRDTQMGGAPGFCWMPAPGLLGRGMCGGGRGMRRMWPHGMGGPLRGMPPHTMHRLMRQRTRGCSKHCSKEGDNPGEVTRGETCTADESQLNHGHTLKNGQENNEEVMSGEKQDGACNGSESCSGSSGEEGGEGMQVPFPMFPVFMGPRKMMKIMARDHGGCYRNRHGKQPNCRRHQGKGDNSHHSCHRRQGDLPGYPMDRDTCTLPSRNHQEQTSTQILGTMQNEDEVLAMDADHN